MDVGQQRVLTAVDQRAHILLGLAHFAVKRSDEARVFQIEFGLLHTTLCDLDLRLGRALCGLGVVQFFLRRRIRCYELRLARHGEVRIGELGLGLFQLRLRRDERGFERPAIDFLQELTGLHRLAFLVFLLDQCSRHTRTDLDALVGHGLGHHADGQFDHARLKRDGLDGRLLGRNCRRRFRTGYRQKHNRYEGQREASQQMVHVRFSGQVQRAGCASNEPPRAKWRLMRCWNSS